MASRLIKIAILLFLGWWLVCCTSAPRYVAKEVPKTAKEQSSKLPPLPKSTTIMTASFYGEEFHGRQTSSGEIFDMYEYTAAHKTLPFGTRLKVTNLANGRSVIVVVNDRGPFIPGRDLDLSYGAARKIGLVGMGVGKVKVRVLKYGTTEKDK
jgi:rare lipoprotein A